MPFVMVTLDTPVPLLMAVTPPRPNTLTQVPHLGLYPRLNRHYLPERSTPDSVFFGKQEDENNPPPAVDRLNVAFHPDSRGSEGHGLFLFCWNDDSAITMSL